MLQKNQIIELVIDDIANDGSGVGRADGLAVFVPNTAVGDRISAKIVKATPRLAYGAVQELLSPGPGRSKDACSGCPVCHRCGSCSLRHLTYAEELRIKGRWVSENLRRIGGIDLPAPPCLPSHASDRYRNKAIYPIRMQNGEPVLGFYAKRSHRVEPIGDCLLHPEVFSALCRAVLGWIRKHRISVYDEQAHAGLIRSLYLRQADATGEVMACMIVNGHFIPAERALTEALRAACPQTVSIILNVNTARTNVLLGRECRTLWGKDSITDRLCGLSFELSPLSFYQVNRRGAEQLYAAAADFAALTGRETLLDLYCGAGTIGLSMAKRVKQLIGVEIIPEAVENARANALRNGVENARFLCGDAADAALALEREGISPDVVVIDPPRKGCAPGLTETIARMNPERVVMVSCDSATAARDAASFNALGYRPVRVQAVDMFPRTAHVETVVLLSKGEIDSKKVRVEFSLEDMDMSEFQDGATYPQIKEYVLEHTGLKVSNLYISQIKRKCGLEVGKNYNLPKSEDSRQPQCPPEKEKAIREAFKYFGMI